MTGQNQTETIDSDGQPGLSDLASNTADPIVADPVALERRGRKWLIWSFIFCPCHLPITMAVLAAIFGGSAFGTLISTNTLGVGLIFGAIYAAGVVVGLRHIRAAVAGRNCADASCEI